MKIDELIQPQNFSNEFKSWFGNSQIVDQSGKPLAVYHGTTRDFEKFSVEFLGTNTTARTSALGFFFTNSPGVAGNFGKGEGGRVLPVYLSIQKPFELKPYSHQYTMMRTDYEMRYNPRNAPLRRHYKSGQDPFHQLDDWAKVLKHQINGGDPSEKLTDQDYSKMRVHMLSKGFDGIICYETYMDAPLGVMSGFHNFYIAFRPEQIRHAMVSEGYASTNS